MYCLDNDGIYPLSMTFDKSTVTLFELSTDIYMLPCIRTSVSISIRLISPIPNVVEAVPFSSTIDCIDNHVEVLVVMAACLSMLLCKANDAMSIMKEVEAWHIHTHGSVGWGQGEYLRRVLRVVCC